jgi:hypothetical protein
MGSIHVRCGEGQGNWKVLGTPLKKNATGIDGWLAGDFDRPHT